MIKVIVFDLDDTLLDTTHLLIPPALDKICHNWQGLSSSFTKEKFFADREVLLKAHSNSEIFELLADKYQLSDKTAGIAFADEAFYNPDIPPHLPLMAGALENLIALKDKYILCLLTAGETLTQDLKVDRAGLRPHFKHVFLADDKVNYKKAPFFAKLITDYKISPEQLLSIGNRRTSEIREAKRLGCTTCFFKFGEHSHEAIENAFDVPDFEIAQHPQLMPTCKL